MKTFLSILGLVCVALGAGCGNSVSIGGGAGGSELSGSATSGQGGVGPGSTGGPGTTSAASTGSAGGSSNNACVDLPVTGPTECPAVWNPDEFNHGLPCNMPNGTTCVFDDPGSGWHACTCGCLTENELYCFGVSGGPNCPASAPAHGSSCAGLLGVTCSYYPKTQCSCLQNGTWKCKETDMEFHCLDPAPSASPPSGVAPSTLIKDLSPTDAEAWCTWYMNAYPPGGQLPPDYPPQNGEAWGGASMSCGELGCLQHLKVEHCVKNLELSACEATLVQLEDCVRTIFRQCTLEGHGCGPFRACGSACDTTIIQVDGSAGDCGVPIE
jgi:hypothetical protein